MAKQQQRKTGKAGAERSGILPAQAIRALVEVGGIRPAMPVAPGQIQPASIDLRLGEVAYRVRATSPSSSTRATTP